ncbi:MAG: DUF4089 domain-containing protein [Elioraea sp.]|nr:DUF4089 domain-containing protein [Elioraea sp.]
MTVPPSPAPRPLSRAEAERLLDAASAALALPVPDPCRPGAVEALLRLSEAAALLLSFPLAQRDEPAPIFRP